VKNFNFLGHLVFCPLLACSLFADPVQPVTPSSTGETTSTRVRDLREEFKALDLQLKLQQAQNALEKQELENKVNLLVRQQALLDLQYPNKTAPSVGPGITITGFEMPIRIQAIRSAKRLSRRIGDCLNEELKASGAKSVLIVTDFTLLARIRAYRQALAELARIRGELDKAEEEPLFEVVYEDKPKAVVGKAKGNKESAVLQPAASFRIVKSSLGSLADIVGFFRSKTDIKQGGDLVAKLGREVISTQLSDGIRGFSWKTRIATLDIGSSKPSDLRKSYGMALTGAQRVRMDLVFAESDLTLAGNRFMQEETKAHRIRVPAGKVAKVRVRDEALTQKKLAVGQFDAFSAMLGTTDDEFGFSRLVALDAVGDLVSSLSPEGYVLCAKLEVASGASRTVTSLWNSGTVSFSSGIAISYALIGKDSQVVLADSVFDYAGWQRMQDEGPDIPINYSEDDRFVEP